MNKKLGKAIRSAFGAPPPPGRDGFLNNLNYPKARFGEFVFTQACYIRKRVWLLSIGLFIAALCGFQFGGAQADANMLWIISSFTPFAALAIVCELSRSSAFNMEELEMSCKHNLSAITLVKLSVLGAFDTVIFALISFVFAGRMDFGLARAALYLLTPFMLTCTLSLLVMNYVKVRETGYICGGVSCFISITNVVASQSIGGFFSEKHMAAWGFVFILKAVLAIFQIYRYVKNMEDRRWNSQLTA